MLIIAKDLMRTQTPTLPFDTTLQDAVKYFARTAHSFALVSTGTRIHGVLTEADLLRAFLQGRGQKSNAEIIQFRQFFQPVQLAIETEQFEDVFRKLLTAVGNRVFVIDRKDNVVGFIQIKDIWSEILGTKERPSLAEVGPPTTQPDQDPMVRLEQQVKNLRNEVFYFSSFFDRSPFMMHSADSTGKILMANEMLHKVLGYEFGDLTGRTIFEIYPEANHDRAREGLKKILSDGYHEPVQGTMLTRRKRVIPVELSSRALIDPGSNDHLGTITVSRILDMSTQLNFMEESES